MVKLYLDWNVMSGMRNGHFTELQALIHDPKRFIIFYSTAHIGDIVASLDGENADRSPALADLEFMTSLTNNLCIYNDGTEVVIDVYHPNELFAQQTSSPEFLSDEAIDQLSRNEEIVARVAAARDDLGGQSLLDLFKAHFENPATAEALRKLYPGLENDLSYGGFLRAAREQFRLLNHTDEYKHYRLAVQGGLGINRDRLYDSAMPFAQISSAYKKLAIPEFQPDMQIKPDWFAAVIGTYNTLDMYGYQEDTIETDKSRKQTQRNTMNDSFHTAFSTLCDYYITDDRRNAKKAAAVFEKLGIATRVMRPMDFASHNAEIFRLSSIDHLRIVQELLKSGKFESQEQNDGTLHSLYTELRLFDYFNRLHIFQPNGADEAIIFLSDTPPPNYKRTLLVEFKQLIEVLNDLFGPDRDNFGSLGAEDVFDNNWRGRSWAFEAVTFRIQFSNGLFELHIELPVQA